MRTTLFVALMALAWPTAAQEAAPPPAMHALLVCGVNKDPEDQQSKLRAVSRLGRLCTEAWGVPAERVRVLMDDGGAPATRESLQRALAELAQAAGPADRVLVYFGGQANVVTNTLRLNLRGPDATHAELAEWLKPLKAAEVTVVLDCPHGGLAVESLAGPGRIVVCACRSDQPYATRFGDYFAPALADPAADRDGNGGVSLLEAFQQACEQIDVFFRDQDLMKSEIALLEDNGDGVPSQQPWRFRDEANVDGARAAEWLPPPATPSGDATWSE